MACMNHQCSGLPTLAVAVAIVTLAAATPASADPIAVTGTVFIDSAGGDFPDIPQPIDELIYTLQGPGLPEARGEVLETSSIHGARGGLVVTTSPVPVPLVAGQPFDLTTRATFTRGQAIEATWPESGRVYDIAGDFLFSSASAILQAGDFGLLVATAPITFDGVLSGSDQATGAILFQQQLRGIGVGRVHLFPENPEFFSFQFDIRPIPEPATLVLIGTGLGGALALKRRRRRGTGALPGRSRRVTKTASIGARHPGVWP